MSSPAALLPHAAGEAVAEVKDKGLFEALSAELERAVRQREKALEELGQIREGRAKEAAAVSAEREKLAGERDGSRKIWPRPGPARRIPRTPTSRRSSSWPRSATRRSSGATA